MHGDAVAYRDYEIRVGREVLLPLLRRWGWNPLGKRVLELGCGEAGLLQPFHEAGCAVAGVEVAPTRAENARRLAAFPMDVFVGDITLPDLPTRLPAGWDLIILRDVIEHLQDKVQTMMNMRALLAPGGRVLLETCPWYMPFGGHHQVLKSWVRHVPWLHVLPRRTYKHLLLHTLKQDPDLVADLVEHTYDRGITMRALNCLIRRTGFTVDREHLYFINPAYRVRFGFPTVRLPFNSRFPLLPEFIATSVSMLLSASDFPA